METLEQAPTAKGTTLEHLLPLAIRSHNGTSFSPERRGNYQITEYSKELDADIFLIKAKAALNLDLTTEDIESTVNRYKAKYKRLLSAWFGSHSNVVSSMIAGPSNFPAARMNKRSEWAHNHYNEFRTYRERALKAIQRSFAVTVDPLEAAKKKLARFEKHHALMIAANKVIRKNKGNEQAQFVALSELGFDGAKASKILSPDFAGRIGFAQFSLTNSNATIKRLIQRVKELEAKAALSETVGTFSKTVGDVEVKWNFEIDRLQLIFPGKPAPEMITKLKRNGFKWSPRYTAWQRQNTANAKQAACFVLGVEKL
jgi:hypothetical protein